jgi:hypothetical protein
VVLRQARSAIREPGSLAALVKRYTEEVDVFNATDHETDEESDAHAESTYQATLKQMVGLPARTAEDALAALDWLIYEGADLSSEYDLHGLDVVNKFSCTVTSLMNAVRDYIAKTAV